MESMLYEELIRRVYNCGRSYDNGATADVYRKMEHAFHDLSVKSHFKTQDAREIEYQTEFSKVRRYVRTAISDGIVKVKYAAEENDIIKLQGMADKLDLRFYDKTESDKVVKEANAIFFKNKLEMR